VTADVSTREGAAALVGGAVERWGRLDVLVNVAGGIKGPIVNPIWDITEEQWSVTLATNLTSVFHTTQLALAPMMQAGRGCIVNTASTSWAGSALHSHYAAAKAGLVSFTRSVATQVGPFGIRVNVVAPGGTRTLAAERPDGTLLREDSEVVKQIPLGRLNEPTDVADAVMFLVSDRARNISGQVLTVAGGLNPSL
jgi:NAD(P)-dependent dehydrogenase (short-subunit alcohol dehydrogenase family)